MTPYVVGVCVGLLAYGLVEAVQAVLRALGSRESTRSRGLGRETRDRGSVEPLEPSCWCGNSLADSRRRAVISTTVRAYCAECGSWSDLRRSNP